MEQMDADHIEDPNTKDGSKRIKADLGASMLARHLTAVGVVDLAGHLRRRSKAK